MLRPSGGWPEPASEVIDLVRQVDRWQTSGFMSRQVHHAVRLEGSWRLYVTAEKRLCSKTKGVPEEDSRRVSRAGVLGVCELPDIDARELRSCEEQQEL